MNIHSSVLPMAMLLCGAFLSKSVQADIINFVVDIQPTEVEAGQSVEWRLFATVSQQSPNNWGISNLSVNLSDSLGESLAPASVGSPFANYTFFAGAFDSSNKKLTEIAATLIQQNNSTAQAIHPNNSMTNTNLGPLLLATGSYVPTTTGLHTLAVEAGSLNSFFTASSQFLGNGQGFTVAVQSDSFTVTAVPETSCLPMVVTSLLLGCCYYRPTRFRKNRNFV